MRRSLALALLAAIAVTFACGRAGPPVRRASAPPPAVAEDPQADAASSADPSHSDKKDGDEEEPK